jgi:hypothetical protein
MSILDVFNTDAFSMVALTDAVNNMSFKPGRIGELGLFEGDGVTVRTVAVEERGDTLKLIPPRDVGSPGTTLDKEKRTLRDIRVPHFPVDDAVMAEEVQGIRDFGSETAVEQIMSKVARRNQTMLQSLEVTSEYSRIGAVKGVITYADNTTLDLFTTFGVSQEDERDWDLDNTNPTDGILRKTCTEVVRQTGGILDGVPFSGLHAFCGDNFFDALLQHAEVRATYAGWTEAQILRDSYIGPRGSSWGIFSFGGINWENYRGSVGGQSYVDTDKCHIFPTGVPGLFRSYWAPGDYVDTVNTVGKRFYAKQMVMRSEKGVELEMQMNELNICTRPRVLLQGRKTS